MTDNSPISVRRIACLYRDGLPTITAGLVVALLAAFVMRSVIDERWLTIWVVLTLVVASSRLLLILYHHRTPDRHSNPASWERRYAMGAALGGALWGALGASFDPAWPPSNQVFLASAPGGVIAGSIPANSASLPAAAAFILLTGIPFGLRTLMLDDTTYQILGVMSLIYSLTMVGLTRRFHGNLVTTLGLSKQLEIRNRALKESLQTREMLLAKTKESARLLHGAFEQAGVAMAIIAPEGDILRANQAAADMLGCEIPEELCGRKVIDLTHPDDRPENRRLFALMLRGRIDRYSVRKRYLRSDGSEVWADLTLAAVRDEEGELQYTVGQAQDVTEQQNLYSQLLHRSTHDPLTGLINRSAFEEQLDLLLSSDSTGQGHILCYLDLDQFKVVNDTCGHLAGDALLREVAHLIRQKIRRSDLLARIGGDEFALIMQDCDPESAGKIFEEIIQTLREYRFPWSGHIFHVGASIGAVAVHPGDGLSLHDLLKRADSACYAAKEAGRNRYRFFKEEDESLTARASEMGWVPRLNWALAENRFVLFRQEIVPVARDEQSEMNRFEVLIRLWDSNGDLQPPGTFIPAAERYNLADVIDLWVVQRVVGWLSEESPHASDTCSINLSGLTLSNQQTLDKIVALLEEHPQATRRICFEITETAAISNLAHTREFMRQLHELGCRFALDDFGSGLSSFAYLKQLPVDYLKIDGLFVRDIARNPVSQALVTSINQVGHAMGMKTVAEFVEDDTILRRLREIGVDYAQGYGVEAPVPWLLGTGEPAGEVPQGGLSRPPEMEVSREPPSQPHSHP